MRLLIRRRGIRHTLAVLTLAVLLASAATAARESVVIYRCTDASGALTLQNDVPCPKGAQQERRVIESPPPGPPSSLAPAVAAPVAAPPAPAAPAAEAAAAAEDTARPSPPPLFECRAYDDRRYLSESANPPEQCVPLQTTGIGGVAGLGAGSACELVTDACEPVAEASLCESWQRRLREAETALRFGRFESREAAQAEVGRAASITLESSCAQ